ncbi:hypothetical protein DBV05_g367 [Lasiodiplodia theobromae]|uniref:Uncharacterized protein n=1 Tax=Lasiodiplodia theobromae TaxID=45133 RepID=A0A5N5DT06_9PEZI|nr:hypothetical protein DBV05_g367 [Lasiodiplodia theobromae]
MLADTAPSLRNLFPNALSLLSLSILLPLFLHLLWRLLLNPQNPKPSTQAHPEGKPTARKKSQSSFYGTPTTTPLNFTNVAPFPTSPSSSSSSPHVSTEPDRWYRDRTLISAPDRVYTPTMALRTCPFDDWLRVDTNYPARMTHKRNVLDAYGWKQVGGAMACRPEAEAAVRELLGYLGEYLLRRFPGVWVSGDDGDGGGRWLRSLVTGERFELVEPWGGLHPLEVVARVTEEDLAVLVPGKGGGGEDEEAEYVLKAAVSAFPAGFDIQEKMDQPLTTIHEPVPTYKEKLKRAMNK